MTAAPRRTATTPAHRRVLPPRDDEFGLECWHGFAPHMSQAHRHEHIEVNLPTTGAISYLLGGHRFQVPAGTTTVFWAGIPHQLVDVAKGTTMHWLHLPMATVLSWGLPEAVITRLLSGQPILAAPGGHHDDPADDEPAELAAADNRSFRQWGRDITGGQAERRDIALLEIEARIRRLARQDHGNRHGVHPPAATGAARPSVDTGGKDATSRAARMAQFLAAHFREPIGVDDVARVVHLNPHYAMTLFRQVVGQTIGSYLNQCRIAEAQRLLMTSDATMPEICTAAGFGSLSRFYASFQETCGQSPGEYRRISTSSRRRS
ncbi:helix-turn-helix domain-containing protein [Micromonospora sp. 067-2]|uniref:helix-turn-helix domain-containing protein n=1 Tax=Micromonospora sp. 067-2 TaxID=2789270 RepID=UPI00397A8ADB